MQNKLQHAFKNIQLNTIKFYTIITFFVFIGLSSFFPYTGDDWAWGSSIGLERLSNFFKDYNGRYLGNLVVILLTRLNLLRIVAMSCVITCIIKLSSKIVNKNSKEVFLMMMMLFLALPSGIFSQAVVWTSGFSNYSVSLLFTLICFDFCIFNAPLKEGSKSQYIMLFLFAVCAALFVENLTLFNIFVSGFMILISIIKKKPNMSHMPFIIGTVVGAIIMFTNSAYFNIAKNTDYYRTVSFSVIGMIRQAINNYFVIIYKDMAHNNVFLNIVICILFIFIVWKNQTTKGSNNVVVNRISISLIYLNTSYAIYTLLCAINSQWKVFISSRITTAFEGVFAMIYIFSIPVLIYFNVYDKARRNRMLLEFGGAIMLVLPLFIVTPIGSRNFIAPYVLMSIIACEAFDIVLYNINETTKRITLSSIRITVVLLLISLLSIYSNIYIAQKRQLAFINEQIDKGVKQVEIDELPYSEYTWNESPLDNESLQMRFKLFYNIDESITLTPREARK